MNRYPLWKNLIVVIALALGLIYTLPNFFGESPAVQLSSSRATIKVDAAAQAKAEDALKAADIAHDGIELASNGLKIRFKSTDAQLKAKDALEKAFNPKADEPTYVVALNLLAASPSWLTKLGALPMYLGLDLRGGVHFQLQVDMQGALTKRLDSTAADLRAALRDKKIRFSITREGERVQLKFADTENRDKARNVISDTQPDLALTESGESSELRLTGTFKPEALIRIKADAVKQNITTLHNRVNELGVAEPVIQQQGADRIVVQLPGVQDPVKARELLGRTANLEVRLVDEEAMLSGNTAGRDVFPENTREGVTRQIIVKKQVVLTGDRFVDASSTIDQQNQQPVVSVKLDSAGGKVMRDVTRENLKKQMAIILLEKGKGEAISVATIQGEFSSQFQISGRFTPEESNTLAILIRAGSLAAPMDIVEERTIGPSLGAENIEKGFHSTMWGFVAIAVFMILYYQLFGLVSVVALASNLLFLIALLSLLQATLTLPGIAAIALTLGMAIDANVLINERIREELRNGASPQAAITAGYERAFDTILDSNITTLIAGLALLIFGSGPVRGFAVVHCLGILTSIFSSVVVSRAIVNLIYGNRKKLTGLAIGQVWKPAAAK